MGCSFGECVQLASEPFYGWKQWDMYLKNKGVSKGLGECHSGDGITYLNFASE